MPNVKRRLEWCLMQSKRADFARRMIAEIKRKGVLVLRIHCAGDFMNEEYAEKWLSIMKACPRVRFYFYSRSWRIPEIAKFEFRGFSGLWNTSSMTRAGLALNS